MTHKPFLQWFLLFTLIMVGATLAYITGIFHKVNEADFTKISFLIYAIFLYFSIRCGINTYYLDNSKSEAGWFTSNALTTLGMIGTVVGFIYMLSTVFVSIDVSQPQTMRTALSKMGCGMGTALYTTAAGLICGLLLKLQLFNLDQHAKQIPK